jgi:hypothetical protein
MNGFELRKREKIILFDKYFAREIKDIVGILEARKQGVLNRMADRTEKQLSVFSKKEDIESLVMEAVSTELSLIKDSIEQDLTLYEFKDLLS